jgi:KAP-like P-loop domain-containing protein
MTLALKETAFADHNRHVREYLAYYISLAHSPKYAVMINGPWGIGKTFLVRKVLRELGRPGEHVYVSLYGMQSVDEIDSALFSAIHPLVGSNGVRIAGRMVGAMAKSAFRFEANLKPEELANKFDGSLFVFDDLERCEMSINAVLGYINEFVEHDGCRVIVIANENEVTKDEHYRSRREKLIGKTLEVQSAFDEALIHFISQIDDPFTNALFKRRAADISSVYHQSQLYNLRILQQTMWDFERFFRILTEKHRQNEEAVSHLMRFLFALSFELKAGRLLATDLRSRLDKVVAGTTTKREKPEPNPLMAASSRYPEVDLNDATLSDDLLVDILAKGLVEEEKIRASLDRSSYFVVRSNEPSWRTVWHWFERTDEEFESAYRKMEQQFDTRQLNIVGEMLHVFGLRLFLSDAGVLKKTRREIVNDSKRYINDMYTQRRLSPLPLDGAGEMVAGGYGGLGIHENETPDFREILQYLRQTQKQAAEDNYPVEATTLLNKMRVDPQAFLRLICLNSNEPGRYYKTPILAFVDPDQFVTTLLRLHPERQRIALTALTLRYEQGRLDRELPQERPWLIAVRDKLTVQAAKLAPISRYRVHWHIENFFTAILAEEEAAELLG